MGRTNKSIELASNRLNRKGKRNSNPRRRRPKSTLVPVVVAIAALFAIALLLVISTPDPEPDAIQFPEIEVSLSPSNPSLYVQVANVSSRHIDIRRVTLIADYEKKGKADLPIMEPPPLATPSDRLLRAMGRARSLTTGPLRVSQAIGNRHKLYESKTRTTLYPSGHDGAVQTFVATLHFPAEPSDDAPALGCQYRFWFELEFEATGDAAPRMRTSTVVTRGRLYRKFDEL